MTVEEYQQELNIANAYKDKQDFKEAEKHYRRALKTAPPEDLQGLINTIREMKEKAKSAPAKSEDRKLPEGFKVPKITFNDVIGYKAQKRVIKRIMELPIKKGERYTHNSMPKSTGIIFYGPPGTGKSFIANGIGGELEVPLKIFHISDILDKMVGGSEKNMRKAFDDAKECQPCIMFFDELDALGASREAANQFTSNDIKNTINEFLMQLSELHETKEATVFVIGATNLPWLIDDAMKRSGRLEHHIFMGPPNFWDRRQLFKYYLAKEGMDYKFRGNLSLLSLATIRYSPADIEKVCTATKRRMLEQDKYLITTRDIQMVLKDKNEGISSLDEWTLKAKQTYLKNSKVVVRHTGFMGLKKQKERVEEQGKMGDAELKTYKPLVNHIKRTMRWWVVCNIIRFLAKGI